MTYDGLTCIDNEIIVTNGDAITSSTLATFKTNYLALSLDEMKDDLISAMKLDPADANIDTTLDLLATQHQRTLQTALTYLMLYKYYYKLGGGEGTQNYDRMMLNKKHYEVRRALFGTLYNKKIGRTRTIPIMR